MPHKFDPAHLEVLLGAGRQAWNSPDAILDHLNLRPDMTVADIGCGPGFFTLDIARRVGPRGIVHAIDVSTEMLQRLQERATQAGLANVRPVLAEAEDEYPVHSDACQAALLANVYHEVDPASNFLSELRRMVASGGSVLVVDWRPEATPIGPPLHARLNPDDVVEEFTQLGFRLDARCEVGPYHYGLRFANER